MFAGTEHDFCGDKDFGFIMNIPVLVNLVYQAY